jgi:DNA replicative helicase MCM subunit Mcm2 (Cdc46/Mcm family)
LVKPGGIEKDVALIETDDADHAAADQAYRTKYVRYARSYVDPVLSANANMLRLIAR